MENCRMIIEMHLQRVNSIINLILEFIHFDFKRFSYSFCLDTTRNKKVKTYFPSVLFSLRLATLQVISLDPPAELPERCPQSDSKNQLHENRSLSIKNIYTLNTNLLC